MGVTSLDLTGGYCNSLVHSITVAFQGCCDAFSDAPLFNTERTSFLAKTGRGHRGLEGFKWEHPKVWGPLIPLLIDGKTGPARKSGDLPRGAQKRGAGPRTQKQLSAAHWMDDAGPRGK